jgi:tetratricopeptide (TPR) repeat protein
MEQKHLLQLLQSRFSPSACIVHNKIIKLLENYQTLSQEEKHNIAVHLINEGSNLLKKENLVAIELFDAAIKIDPQDSDIWYQEGEAFFEYGYKGKNERALKLAEKYLKKAVELSSENIQYYWKTARTLSELGVLKKDVVLYADAKEFFQKAFVLSNGMHKHELALLNWDYGKLLSYIAETSGEAIDVRIAIDAYNIASNYDNIMPAKFWYDFGNMYLHMGQLINDNKYYLKALECLKKASVLSPDMMATMMSIAHVYTELYFNTLHNDYFNEAHKTFENIVKIEKQNGDVWLKWAQLLSESGKINEDVKKLKLAVEKSIQANKYNAKNPYVIGQWVEALALLGASSGRLDYIWEAENKITKALDIYSNIAELWYAYGICLRAYGDYYNDTVYYEQAIEKFQVGLSYDQTNAELWYVVAKTHALLADEDSEDEEQFKKASRFFIKAVSLKPYAPSITFDYAKLLFKYAENFENIDILKQSIAQFESLLSCQKNVLLEHASWLFYYGEALGLLGDLAEEDEYFLKALEIFTNVLLINPDYPQIYYCMAIYMLKVAEIKEDAAYFNRAIGFFQSAVKQNEDDDTAYLEWGLALATKALATTDKEIAKQIFLEAEQKIVKAGQLGDQEAYYHLACLYSILNRLTEAFALLDKAKTLDVLPSVSDMMDDEWLENLRNHPNFSRFLAELERKL